MKKWFNLRRMLGTRTRNRLIAYRKIIAIVILLIVLLIVVLMDLVPASIRFSRQKSSTPTEQSKLESDSSHTGVKKILVMSYMRSGSTFTTEALRQGEGTSFLSFEPLWKIFGKGYVLPDLICKRDGDCDTPVTEEETAESAIKILKNIFECDLSTLPNSVIQSFARFEQNGNDKRMRRCISSSKNSDKKKSRKQGRMEARKRRCIEQIEDKCKSANLRIVKTIRVSMQLVENILAEIPGLKIVHLLRDPRAIMHSRKQIGEVDAISFTPHAYQLCNRMYYDVINTQTSMAIYPENIVPVMYECLAEDSFFAIKKIYKMLGLQCTSHTDEWIQKFTAHSGPKTEVTPGYEERGQESNTPGGPSSDDSTNKDEEDYGDESDNENSENDDNSKSEETDPTLIRVPRYTVYKANSELQASSWRKSMSFVELQVVDSQCLTIYTELNFNYIEREEDLTDLNIKTREDSWYLSGLCKS